MNRYQIVFDKTGISHTFWTDSQENARSMAANLRKAGFLNVAVFEHTEDGAYMTDL